jgi:hypothetical protein
VGVFSRWGCLVAEIALRSCTASAGPVPVIL